MAWPAGWAWGGGVGDGAQRVGEHTQILETFENVDTSED